MTPLLLLLSLAAVFFGAQLFTNGIEHLGARLQLAEGVTGSVFAAIATAMPEATVPIIAMVGTSPYTLVRQDVAVGAIVGAPLMLATLTVFVAGLAAALTRGPAAALRPEPTGLRRDLSWFLVCFGLAALATLVPENAHWIKAAIAVLLVLLYLLYLFVTFRSSPALVASGHGTQTGHALYFSRLPLCSGLPGILAQTGFGLALIALGTKGFIVVVERLSSDWPPLVLSLFLIPIATELPEKVNSVLWIRRGGRDTLAFANITGALVFQGTLLPALGIWLTPWTLRPDVLLGMVLALIPSFYLLILVTRAVIRPYHLVFNGLCYVLYFFLIGR